MLLQRFRLTGCGLLFLVLGSVLLLSACSPSRIYLPESQVEYAEVPGGSIARIWGDELPADVDERVEVMRRQFGERGERSVFLDPPTYLAISGGGARGAFGAGLLKGWSESGTRPEIHIVSGVSTGALIAPFAFLGSDYDEDLEYFYTRISTDNLIAERSFFRTLLGDAVYDTRRFRKLLRDEVDAVMIKRIAEEYDRGRRLLIGTTNLEAKRPVIWNIGAIAKVGTEEANQLIRDVILASASIPGAFPPVKIKVRVGDEVYEEIHVDGGVSNQVFLYPTQVDLGKGVESIGLRPGDQIIYVIRNGYLDARWARVDLNIRSILGSSLESVIRMQGIGDLYRIYLGTLREGAEFRLAYIPAEFDHPATEFFDPEYMRALFQLGYESARTGYPWATSPPGFEIQQ